MCEGCLHVFQLVKMNPPIINSSSSVSTTKRKREAERSVNWSVEETQVLLCAWSDERVQKSLSENLRNRHVFKHLSARMSDMGFSRSPHQCRLRVKTLKANYVRAKLHRSVDVSQPCSFRYFAEMDAVLGRRERGGTYFISPGSPNDSTDRTRSIRSDFTSNAEIVGQHLVSSGRMGLEREGLSDSEERQCWQMDSEVKTEDAEVSTDEFEFSGTGFPPQHTTNRQDVYMGPSINQDGTLVENGFSTPPQRPRNREQGYLRPSINQEISGTPVENGFSTPPRIVSAPPPPLPASIPPPLPPPHFTRPVASADPDPDLSNAAPKCGTHHQCGHPEPAHGHLSECLQRLCTETRGLLVQLDAQARRHHDLLEQWLRGEERRQREAADREERREKARMEHEIRVLQLLTGLVKDNGCRCRCRCTCGGSNNTGAEEKTSPNAKNKDGQ